MAHVSSSILILFGVISLFAFAFPFVKDGVLKQLNPKGIAGALLPFILVLLPFAALFGLAAVMGIPINQTLPSFAGAAVLSFLLNRIGLPAQLRGVLLLVCAYLFTMSVQVESGPQFVLAATMLGLLVAKIADHLLFDGERSLDDILPPLIWLTTVAWATPFEAKVAEQREGLILGVTCVAMFLRVMQRPLLREDKVFIKRVVLAASGGLFVLMVITKLILAPDLQPLALLCGGGMFATYLFMNIDKEGQGNINGATAVKLLIVTGMLTMVATRFFGMFGLLALAPCALVAPWPGITQFAGAFFCIRVLLQLFITTYNSNVTGINIEHAYVGAAEYAGFIAMACLTLLLREVKDRRVLTALFLAAGALLPLAANYYLHAEPTSSLLVASTVAAVIFAILGPAFMQGETVGYENVVLLPAVMTVVGVTFGGLIEAGNEATNMFRGQVLGYAAGILIILVLAHWIFGRYTRAKKQEPVAPSRI